MRTMLYFVLGLLLTAPARAQTPGRQTDLVMATVRLSNLKSTATGFALVRPRTGGEAGEATDQYILVTAAHVLEMSDGEEMTVNYRRKTGEGEFSKAPAPLKIRSEGKPLWQRHAKQDVAAMAIEPPAGAELPRLTIDLLATADDLRGIEPGDLVRCVGFPHATVFEPNQASFPVVRLGCVASYPLLPVEKEPTFLVDYNTFEGDSGGPVYWKRGNGDDASLKILGLVQGQHFFNQRFEFTYESGEFRKQLGLAIVTQAEAIRETIAQVP
ncbi:MAG TPA: trypsin-like serine protease [Pirellulales bacterium]|nr:trypsin-like serine protease [Pirellulales bacterium]